MQKFLKYTGKRKPAHSRNKHRVRGYFSLLVFGLFLLACSKEQINAPQAIKELIAGSGDCTSCPSFVDKYLWRNQTVYIYTCSGIACNCMVLYYNEKGEKLLMAQGYSFDAFRQEARLTTHVWTCKK